MRCESCNLDDLSGSYCSYCGSALVEVANGCRGCGAEDVSGNFCIYCGEPLGSEEPGPQDYVCPNCGADDQTMKFCRKCGSAMSDRITGSTRSHTEKVNREAKFYAYCRMHYGNCDRFGSPGILAKACSVCGAEAKYLEF